MQWWCVAQGIPWTWTWRPYAGVWLMVILLASAYWRAYRSSDRAANENSADRRLRIASAVAGVLCLWIALDWPVGTLGAGYMASVHMVQFILIAMVAPPLLLYGIPPVAVAGLEAPPGAARTTRSVAVPIITLVALNIAVISTHAPTVVDSLMVSQLGSFALDTIWLVSALAFWWPIVWNIPGEPPLPTPVKIAYFVAGTFSHTGVAMYLLLSEFPVYRTFELAPPIQGVSPLSDQAIAGGLMLLAGIVLVLGSVSVLFFRWQREMGE